MKLTTTLERESQFVSILKKQLRKKAHRGRGTRLPSS